MPGLTASDVAQLYRNQGKEPPHEFADAPALKNRSEKFGRIKKEAGGIIFDSTSEANAYQVLRLWLSAGAISDLRLQPVFTLQEKFKDHEGKTVRSTRYTADFQFFDCATKRTRYVDVKGIITPAFKRSIRQMKDKHPGVEIEIWDRDKVKELSRMLKYEEKFGVPPVPVEIHPVPIPNVQCRVCGAERPNDGLKCEACQSYQNPEVGRPMTTNYFARLQWDERKSLEQERISRRRRLAEQC